MFYVTILYYYYIFNLEESSRSIKRSIQNNSEKPKKEKLKQQNGRINPVYRYIFFSLFSIVYNTKKRKKNGVYKTHKKYKILKSFMYYIV